MDKYNEFMSYTDPDEQALNFIFCINGVVGIVKEWIHSGYKWSVERISNFIVDMAFRSVGMNPSEQK